MHAAWRRHVPSLVFAVICLVFVASYVVSISLLIVQIGGQDYMTLGDDGYITLRYASHLAEGEGIVWNRGDEPVEGGTSFLWVLLIAAAYLFMGDPALPLVIFSAFLHLVSLLLLWKLLGRLGLATGFRIAGVLVLGADWSMRHQVLAGMEYPLLITLFLGALLVLAAHEPGRTPTRAKVLCAVLAGALPLVRPEALLLTLIVFACACARWQLGWRRPWSAPIWLSAYLLPIVLLSLFRIAYFGEWVPNTYFLKVASSGEKIRRGIEYTYAYFFRYQIALLLIPVCAATLIACKEKWLKVLTAGLPVLLASALLLGADTLRWRFMIPFTLIFLVALLHLLDLAYSRANRLWRVCIVGLLLGLVGTWNFETVRQHRVRGNPSKILPGRSNNIRLGLLLRQACEGDASIAVFAAGAVPLYSGLYTIDMLGRNDPYIAKLPAVPGLPLGHNKFDFDYVMRRNPDLIFSWVALGDEERVRAEDRVGFDTELLRNEEFQHRYRPVDSRLSREWRGIYLREDTPRCSAEQLVALEGALF